MMLSTIEYKGYIGSVEFSEEDDVLYGKLQFIGALVSYEGESITELRKSFEYMVDEYLQFCIEKNIEPEKPFKGSFNVRIEPDLHRQAARYAKQNGLSLNAVVSGAIKNLVQGQSYV